MTTPAQQNPENDSPSFKIGGESFRCVDYVPHWNVMRLAAAMDGPDEMHALAAMYRFIINMVHPEERERLDEFLSTIDLEHSDLDNAIGDTLVEMAGRGKVSGPPVGIPPSGAEFGHSSDGSTETSPTRRVVSLSQGTVKVEPYIEGPSSIN